MEIIGPLVDCVKAISPPIRRQINYCKNLEENIRSLKGEMKKLRAREDDITKQVNDEELRCGKTRREEVRIWLNDVQNMKDDFMKDDFPKIEREAGRRKNCFWRAKHGKLVVEKLQQVEKLRTRGSFSGGLTIDAPNLPRTILTVPIEGGATTKRNVTEILRCLRGEECQKIGVYGLGGVGKTTIMQHINNQLKETGEFDDVIWVTVSQAFNAERIQDKIAAKLRLDLSTCNDETERPARLSALLEHKKRYVLILDDLWKEFSLEDVGIPEPTSMNGCKLAITTRSLDVCKKMDCKPIPVNLLSHDEAFDLFISKLAPKPKLPPKIHKIAEDLVKECAGLPLALVTVAGSMKGVDDIREWKNARNELTNAAEGVIDFESKVFERLKFSYNRLKDEKDQQCFLYCALYPEDCMISREELIHHWIAEGLINDLRSLKARIDKGHTILNRLVNRCLLLQEFNISDYVKLHDVVRDMALRITKSSPRFTVKAGVKLTESLDEYWAKDLERVSLMDNEVEELWGGPPDCRKLLTVLLSKNPLRHISNHFFHHMPNLKVLDLSDTGIESLPESVYLLKNLRELSLERCRQLSLLSSLENLEALSDLNLAYSGICHLPAGMDKLMKLEKLNLHYIFPEGEVKLPDVIHVKCLRIGNGTIKCSIQRILSIERLEILEVVFPNLQKFNKYVRSPQCQQLSDYKIAVGNYILENCRQSKTVCIEGCNFTSGEDPLALPCDVEVLDIRDCTGVRSLTVQNTRDLETCEISDCVGMETVFHSSAPFEEDCYLGSLKKLTVDELPDLRDVFSNVTSANATLSNLTVVFIRRCWKLRCMFPFRLSLEFKNLKDLSIVLCDQLEAIVTDEMDSNSIKEHHSGVVSFPSLKTLSLWGLDELKSIYNGLTRWESLEEIQILWCYKLRRLPLALRKENGQISPPAALKKITAQEDWWESIEWDDPDAKAALQRFFVKW